MAGAPYVQTALQASLGNFGPIFIAVSMALFAFTTPVSYTHLDVYKRQPMFMDKLVPGGTLICSGILNERADEVRAALEAQGFVISDHANSEDWSAFTAKK